MGFTDRVRAWFRGDTTSTPRSRPAKRTSSAVRELEEFATSRKGVEAFVEPRTAVYSTTLLFVADDGEYLRRPIDGTAQAAALCKRCGVPLYDARKVGYPKRLRDFERGHRARPIELDDLPPWPGDEPDEHA